MTDRPSSHRTFLPLGIDLRGTRCVVIGGGAVGTRKAATLAGAGARVAVVAPVVTDELHALITAGTVQWIEARYQETHGRDAFLVVAATDDLGLNAAITREARRAGALVCDASSREGSQVIFGALCDRDDATIAVFTDGRDPSHARRTRDRVADLLARDPEREAKR